MSFGSPIVFNEDIQERRFIPLAGISARRDDPNSFNESLLQELIDATPNVLPVREYLPSTTTLFSLGREVPVDLGANNGYIDNLLVTNDGYLVIVETKLYRNPEGIREVIAQTLQYGMAVGQMPVIELEARIKRGQSPALSVHPEHVFLLRRLADDLKASIFAGLTFIDSANLSAPINQGLWLLRTETTEHGRSFQYIWQGKKHPTEFERKMGVKSYRPHITLVEFPIGEKYATRIAAAICYDATDLDLAADLRDRSDIFMVAALNKDVQTFDNMVSALNFHMYQPVVLANSGEFGGSTAQAPLPKHERLITHLHGNNQVGVSVFEIDPTPFKSTKAGKALKELKTSPAGYSGRPV